MKKEGNKFKLYFLIVLSIFDEKGILKFRTEDENPHRLEEHIWRDEEIIGKSWNQPEVRARIRSHYRNNPKELHSFGVLTGEDSAMNYVRTGEQEIKPGHYLLTYTDGLEPIIFSGDFSDRLRHNDLKGINILCRKKVKSEGALILTQSKPL